MSVHTILADTSEITKPNSCQIPGCQLEVHDEAAPMLHQGVTKYDAAWSVTSMLDESDGRWEIDAVSTYRRDLTLEEARAFAEAIILVTSWCEILSTPMEAEA